MNHITAYLAAELDARFEMFFDGYGNAVARIVDTTNPEHLVSWAKVAIPDVTDDAMHQMLAKSAMQEAVEIVNMAISINKRARTTFSTASTAGVAISQSTR